MQRYSIPAPSEENVNGLKDFLVNHGGLDYFDEITAEWVDGKSRVTILMKNRAAITIKEYTESTSLTVNNRYFPSYDGWNVYNIGYGYMTDTAIVLAPLSSRGYIAYPFPIVICKTQKGYTCVFHPTYNSSSSSESAGYSQSNSYSMTRCYIIDNEGTLTNWDTYLYQNNGNIYNVLTTAHIPGRVDVVKDVYYATNRPFYQMAQPFMLDIGGESYASFAYNTILIKTT